MLLFLPRIGYSENITASYVINDNKLNFISCYNELRKSHYRTEIINNKKEELNFDIFDKYRKFISSYHNKLFNPSIDIYYS